jgi:hypothetical protein
MYELSVITPEATFFSGLNENNGKMACKQMFCASRIM